MAILPATGSEMAMGRVKKAYTNVAPVANANITLSGTLGANYGGKTAGTQISLTATFGGKTTPYAY
jgi:hypothetical protein